MAGAFLRNCWYVAARAEELTRAPLGRLLLSEPVVMFRKEDGTAVALEDRCCHRRAPLSKGRVKGDLIECGYHGFTYEAGGICVSIPGQERVPPGIGVRAYPLVEKHGFAWIWMGEPAKADPASIPDFGRNRAPGWVAVGSRLPIAAHYLLMIENLIDLSHVGFVHAKTIGTDDSRAALKFERGEGVVRVVREPVEVATAPHNLKQGLGPRSVLEKTIRFLPPSHVLIDVRTTEVAPEKAKPLSLGITVLNACTPETERSTHYFWASARDYQLDDRQADAFLARITVEAFNEDKDMLEAQQKCIELDPSAPTINVQADWGGVQARRLVTQLLDREAAPPAVAAQ